MMKKRAIFAINLPALIHMYMSRVFQYIRAYKNVYIAPKLFFMLLVWSSKGDN